MRNVLNKAAFLALALGAVAVGAQARADCFQTYQTNFAPAPALALQLADLRLVDPGDASQDIGPRFRVFFRNNAPGFSQPFDLVVAAGLDNKFTPAMPQAIERISSIAPGQAISADIRLPAECLALPGSGPKPSPFSTVFVLVRSQANLLGAAQLNTLVALPASSIRQVNISLLRPNSVVVPIGATLTLTGEGFGLTPGQVFLNLNGLSLAAQIVQWGPLGIRVQLPTLPLAASAPGELRIIRNDGQTAPILPLRVNPAAVAAVAGAVAVPAGGVAVPAAAGGVAVPAAGAAVPAASGVAVPANGAAAPAPPANIGPANAGPANAGPANAGPANVAPPAGAPNGAAAPAGAPGVNVNPNLQPHGPKAAPPAGGQPPVQQGGISAPGLNAGLLQRPAGQNVGPQGAPQSQQLAPPAAAGQPPVQQGNPSQPSVNAGLLQRPAGQSAASPGSQSFVAQGAGLLQRPAAH